MDHARLHAEGLSKIINGLNDITRVLPLIERLAGFLLQKQSDPTSRLAFLSLLNAYFSNVSILDYDISRCPVFPFAIKALRDSSESVRDFAS